MSITCNTHQKDKRTAAGDRMARSRQRRRAGYQTALVDINQNQISELVRRGFLSLEEKADAYRVGDAVAHLIDGILIIRQT